MSSNLVKRNIYGAVVVITAIALIAFFIAELCFGIDLNNWIFYIIVCGLFVGIFRFSNFRQAVREDKKYGNPKK